MPWIILVIAGLLEVVWSLGMKLTEGFTRPVPSVITLVSLVASLLMLAHAIRTLPVGTAYAVWVGIGAALTVIWAMLTGDTEVSWVKLALIAGLVGCVVGLKLVDH